LAEKGAWPVVGKDGFALTLPLEQSDMKGDIEARADFDAYDLRGDCRIADDILPTTYLGSGKLGDGALIECGEQHEAAGACHAGHFRLHFPP
jgi:hypothetical protein